MTNNIDFQVVGDRKIHCVSCETLITLMLKRLPGIEQVTPSARTQQVMVIYDDNQTSAEQIEAKLGEIGFTVELIPAR